MTKKIRLIDEPESNESVDSENPTTSLDNDQLMKYAEAIDWKLWELLQTIQRVEKKLTVIDTDGINDDDD